MKLRKALRSVRLLFFPEQLPNVIRFHVGTIDRSDLPAQEQPPIRTCVAIGCRDRCRQFSIFCLKHIMADAVTLVAPRPKQGLSQDIVKRFRRVQRLIMTEFSDIHYGKHYREETAA